MTVERNYQFHANVRRHLPVADRFNASSNFNYRHFANSPQIVLHAARKIATCDASLAIAATLIVKDFIIFKQRVKVLARSWRRNVHRHTLSRVNWLKNYYKGKFLYEGKFVSYL